jgi:hypothetical protein
MLTVDEDPLTDEKVAFTGGEADGIAFGVKCWDSSPPAAIAFILTGEQYDQSADYADVVPVQFRVDKQPIQNLSLNIAELDGKLVLRGSIETESGLLAFIRSLATASSRVAIGIGGNAYVVRASGAAAAVTKLIATCHLGTN